ncbi:hypothetical protein EB061_12990 [bacterium]|nr:hypothetical protein [bacterium]
MKFLALVSSLMVSSAAFATPALDEAFYTLQAPTITQVSSVDHHYKGILGVYGKMCTIVTGN